MDKVAWEHLRQTLGLRIEQIEAIPRNPLRAARKAAFKDVLADMDSIEGQALDETEAMFTRRSA